jgi:hypothetical protein
MNRTTPPRLKWSRSHDGDGCVSFWASTGKRHHSLCFSVEYTPPAIGQRRARVQLIAWAGPDDTPVVDRTERFTGDLAAFLSGLHVFQIALIDETAERLEAKAAAVRNLLSLT